MTIQAKILELIQEIQKKKDLSVIYITHDLGVVAKVADFVNVMYAGKIVETGTINEISMILNILILGVYYHLCQI